MSFLRTLNDALGMKIPPGAAVLLTFSKRLHSLYMLRLFNDCWAVFFLYLSILTICARRRALGTILFRCVALPRCGNCQWRFSITHCLRSLAISVKMSVLLMLPAWGLVMLLEEGLLRTVLLGGSLLAVQVRERDFAANAGSADYTDVDLVSHRLDWVGLSSLTTGDLMLHEHSTFHAFSCISGQSIGVSFQRTSFSAAPLLSYSFCAMSLSYGGPSTSCAAVGAVCDACCKRL